jgi:hypothetical protein
MGTRATFSQQWTAVFCPEIAKMLIFNGYFFLVFSKNSLYFCPEVLCRQRQGRGGQKGTSYKLQIVPHKAETTIYCAVFQINKKPSLSPFRATQRVLFIRRALPYAIAPWAVGPWGQGWSLVFSAT